jgi:hypothetical protein
MSNSAETARPIKASRFICILLLQFFTPPHICEREQEENDGQSDIEQIIKHISSLRDKSGISAIHPAFGIALQSPTLSKHRSSFPSRPARGRQADLIARSKDSDARAEFIDRRPLHIFDARPLNQISIYPSPSNRDRRQL